MALATTPRRILYFGSFEVDLASGELRRQGGKVRLQDQPFRLLALLLERAGEVVTREELRDQLWPADTFVDFDHSLNTAVRKLREALGDSAESPRYIETLAKRGYRFVAAVTEPGSTAQPGPSADADGPSLPPPTTARLRASARGALVVAALVCAAALVTYYSVARRPRRPAPPGQRLTLAVLPFDNLSGDADQEYLSDGLTEEMITQLARLEPDRLRVTARSSTSKYKRADRDMGQLRQELGADYVLEGSLRRSGERVRVSVQLIQAVDQTHVWAQTYDRDLRDVLVLQSEIARAVAAATALTLTPDAHARLARARPVHAESHLDYLRGRYFFWNRRSEAGLRQALGYFQRSIAADPDYAPAYSGLADCYMSLGASSVVGGLPPRQAMPEAKAAALRALQVDPALAEAHNSLANVHLLYDWDLAASEKEFRRAIELDPDFTTAHHWYSHTLMALGRTEESLAASKRALELEPMNLVINGHLGWHYYYARQYDQAIEQYRKTLELDPTPLLQRYAAWAYLQQGRHGEAIAALRAALSAVRRNPTVEGDLGYALAVSGRRAEALAVLEGLQQLSSTRYVSPYSVALVHAGLGDRDRALAWLDKAYDERSDYMPYLKREPMLDSLRSDPRFDALVRRVGLP
jgi:TolB-like protein/DNA-binding winged helix-turn-helix (wHTH) protein/Tfp pilus assembly protein PilF